MAPYLSLSVDRKSRLQCWNILLRKSITEPILVRQLSSPLWCVIQGLAVKRQFCSSLPNNVKREFNKMESSHIPSVHSFCPSSLPCSLLSPSESTKDGNIHGDWNSSWITSFCTVDFSQGVSLNIRMAFQPLWWVQVRLCFSNINHSFECERLLNATPRGQRPTSFTQI